MKLGPDYYRLKTMVKRSIEQEIGNKNFGARSGNYEKKRCGQESGNKTACTKNSWRLLAMGVQRGSVSKGDNSSFRHDINKRGKMFTSRISISEFFHAAE